MQCDPHPSGCECPACSLAAFLAGLYATQFPSDARQDTAHRARCPVFAAYGFCHMSVGCFLPHFAPHPPGPGPRLVPHDGAWADEQLTQAPADRCPPQECAAAVAEALAGLGGSEWACAVCGQRTLWPPSSVLVDPLQHAKCATCGVGPLTRSCVQLVEALLLESGDDYVAFKAAVDAARAALPPRARIAFSADAHRIATSYFGWSVFGPDDAAAVVAALREAGMERVVSMGAGTGYVEHVVAAAASDGGRPLPVAAFDELHRPGRFSVAVSLRSAAADFLPADCGPVALLLSWPPFGGPGQEHATMGHDAVSAFLARGGRVVVYIGDISSTGDPGFHGVLDGHFEAAPGWRCRRELRRWVPGDLGLVYAGQDSVGVYVRRP